MSQSTVRAASGPDHRDLYLLVIGILAGVLLGPGVLGRVAPASYNRLFVGDLAEQEEIRAKAQTLAREMQATTAAIAASGVTETYLPEKLAQMQEQQEQVLRPLRARAAEAQALHSARLRGLLLALVLALVGFMAVEALVDPGAGLRAAGFRKVVASVRYALLALWIAVVLGQQEMLRSVPLGFVAGLVVVALGAAGLAQVLPGLVKGGGRDS